MTTLLAVALPSLLEFNVIVPVDVIVPPERPVPEVAIEVTVPAFLVYPQPETVSVVMVELIVISPEAAEIETLVPGFKFSVLFAFCSNLTASVPFPLICK